MQINNKHLALFVVLINLSILNCFGQNRTIFGQVLDYETHQPVTGIKVKINGITTNSVTDKNGFYKISVPENLSDVEFTDFPEKKISEQEPIGKDKINLYLSDFSQEDIYNLTLEELMNIKVDVASKVTESVYQAPGVVSVITAKEIESFGGSSLRDILERVTSVVGLTGFGNRNIISMRGDQILPFSSHILVLINGRPTRESIAGGDDNDIYGMFPINCIEQIEIIRGPGSVLYGTNAYTGIINIVTKHTGEYFSASASGGSPTAYLAAASGASKVGKGTLSGGVYYKNTQNWEQSLTLETGVDTTFNTHENGLGASLSYYLGNLAVNTSYIAGSNFLVGPETGGNYGTFNRHFIDVGYTHQFSEKIRTTLNTTNTYSYSSGIPIHPRRTSNDLVVEATAYLNPNERLNIVAGSLVNHISGIEKRMIREIIEPSMPWYTDVRYSFYSQVDYKLPASLKAIGGFQLHKYSQNVPPRFVPRFGIIWAPKELIIVKALYAQAFRSPSATETTLNEIRRKGNPDLNPEVVNSFDLEFLYINKKLQSSLTFFTNEQRNIISLDENINPKSYINKGSFSARGIEFEMKYIPNANTYFTGSCSYQTNRLGDRMKNATTAPFTAKAGVSHTFNFGLSAGIFNVYNSTPPDVAVRYPARRISNPVPKAFNLLSANIDYNLKDAFKLEKTNITLNLRAENILNEEIYTAEWIRSIINSIPGKPGRRIFFGVKIGI